jgi:hypothetical protein
MSSFCESTEQDLRSEAASDRYAIQRETIAYEFTESANDARWSRWCMQAERLLGHDLDGDQALNGYSLDEAWELYTKKRLRGELRITPEQYAKLVRNRLGYNPRSGLHELLPPARIPGRRLAGHFITPQTKGNHLETNFNRRHHRRNHRHGNKHSAGVA